MVSATAALAALSVALLLTMPAVTATGQTLRASHESETTRQALAQLRESLSEAARALAGVEKRETRALAAVADRPTLRDALEVEPLRQAVLDDRRANHVTQLSETLLNLPPPTR
ncbi:MAG: hypothetical protein AAGE65_15150 [Planctomycetota bacterium]